MRKALYASRVRGYRLHWKKAPGRPDIAFPGRRLAVFVFGCYWHRCERCELPVPKSNTDFWVHKFTLNKERDRRKRMELESMGWEVVELWECDIKHSLSECVGRVRSAHQRRTLERKKSHAHFRSMAYSDDITNAGEIDDIALMSRAEV